MPDLLTLRPLPRRDEVKQARHATESSSMKAISEAQDKWERSVGYVYFVAAGDPHVAVKIGISTKATVKKRLRSLQSSNHECLFLLAVIPFEKGDPPEERERPMVDAQQRERELHQQFAHLQRFEKSWVGSEWFTMAPELLAFIDDVATPAEELLLPRSIFRPGPGLSIQTP